MDLRSRILILSLAVIALLIVGIYFFNYLPDDTFITLRYARNILRGEGFVFNPGERLEAYTNFLWLIIIVLVGKFGGSLIPAARTLSFIFSLGILVLAGIAARSSCTIPPRRSWNCGLAITLPPMMLVASAPFLAWSLSGTEIPLFTFLLLLGFILIRSGKSPGAVFTVFGLLGLVRPEGLLFYFLAGAIMQVRNPKKGEVLLKGLGILAAFYIPYMVWKWHYFGALVPNTFFAKTGPLMLMVRNGKNYLTDFFKSYGYFLVIGLILQRKRISSAENVIIPSLFILTHWSEVLILGGDWMPHYRLLLPTFPLIVLVLSNGLITSAAKGAVMAKNADPGSGEKLIETGGKPPNEDKAPGSPTSPKWSNPVPVIASMLVFLSMVPGGFRYGRFTGERRAVRVFERLGQQLHDMLPPQTRIGCGSIGAIGYYTDMPIIDILGLTEARIARKGKIVANQPGHMKTDGKYVLERKPDLLLLGNIQIHSGRRGEEKMQHKVQENDIITQPGFNENYEFVNIPLGRNFFLSCYKRRDYFLPIE